MTRPTKHRVEGTSTTWRTMLIIWGVLAVVACVAYLVLPERELPPSPVTIAFEPRPTRDAEPAQFRPVDFGDSSSDRRNRRRDPAARGDFTPAKPDSPYAVSGTIAEAESGNPAKSCYVTINYLPSEDEVEAVRESEAAAPDEMVENGKPPEPVEIKRFRARVRSDAEGKFNIRVDYPGRYLIRIVSGSYLETPPIEAILTAEEPKAEVEFKVQLGATVMGRVTEEETDKPVAGLSIFSDKGNETKTDETGNYSLSGLPTGEALVWLNLRDRPYEVVGRAPQRSVNVKEPMEVITGVDFVLKPAGEVWGYVLDVEGKPLDDVDAVLTTSESIMQQAVNAAVKQAPPLSDSAREDGYYELVGVPLGREFRVHVLPKNAEPQLSDPFLLNETQRSIRVDFTLTGGTDVFGTVVSSAGGVVPQAQVVCIPAYENFLVPLAQAQAFRETRANENGTFRIENLPVGSYQIFAQKQGFKIVTRGEPVYPEGSGDIRDVEVLLTPIESGDHRVFGTVTDTAGKPISAAQLSLAGIDADSLTADGRDTTTDASGYFEFNNVSGGYIVLTVAAKEHGRKIVNEVNLDEPTDITMQSLGVVRGKILASGSVPESGASLVYVSAMPTLDGTVQSGFLETLDAIDDATGYGPFAINSDYEIYLPAGSYTLDATAHGFTPGRRSITLGEGETLEQIDLTISKEGASIDGFVSLVDGKSPGGGEAWLSGGGLESSLPGLGASIQNLVGGQRTVLNNSGAFHFGNLPEGTYTVFASVPGYAQGQSQPVVLAARQEETGVQITIGKGGNLQGYVSQRGKVVPGAIVAIAGSATYTNVTTADNNGQYLLETIPEGNYVATAVIPNMEDMFSTFSPMQGRVTIKEGQTTVFNFTNEGGATISASVTPEPRSGRIAFAMLHMGGGPGALSDLNLMDPMSWYAGESGDGALISRMSRIQRGGFEMEDIQPGEYTLDIYFVSIGEALSGGMRLMYSTPVQVTGDEVITLDIQMEE